MTEQEFDLNVFPLKDKVFRLAKRLLNNTEDARDAMMETLTRLWQKRNVLHEYQSVEALAMSITKNFCLDRLKSLEARHKKLDAEFNTINHSNPQIQLEASDAFQIVNRLIDRLPDQQKIVIHLRDVEGLEFIRIAEITGMTENNVKVTLSRARKSINIQLQKIYNYGL